MFLTKLTVTLDTTSNNSSTGGYFYTDRPVNGFIHAVEYVRGTNTFASTGVWNVYVGSTVREVLEKTVSTDSWIVYPRKATVDTTAQTIGATTDYMGVPIPVVNERLVVGLTGGTSAAQDGDMVIYVEGA